MQALLNPAAQCLTLSRNSPASSASRVGSNRGDKGSGLTLVLNALPLKFDGRIVLLEPKADASEFPSLITPAETETAFSQRFVLDVILPHADAKPQPPAAQQIRLGRLLGNEAGLPLRGYQHPAR